MNRLDTDSADRPGELQELRRWVEKLERRYSLVRRDVRELKRDLSTEIASLREWTERQVHEMRRSMESRLDALEHPRSREVGMDPFGE